MKHNQVQVTSKFHKLLFTVSTYLCLKQQTHPVVNQLENPLLFLVLFCILYQKIVSNLQHKVKEENLLYNYEQYGN